MSRYKIGQLTKTMGVSPHLLKHYEKFDLIYPRKDQETNYRYYDFGQFGRLIQSKKYRNLGFSIKDTSDMINGANNETLNRHLNTHINQLVENIAKLQLQKQLTEIIYKESQQCDEYLDQWFIEMMPGYHILKQSNNRELIEVNHSLLDDEINLIDYVPIVESLLLIPKENLQAPDFHYHWCLGIQDERLDQLAVTLDERFIFVPSHRAFVTYVKLETPYTENQRLILKIKSLFDPYPFTCCDNLLATLIKSSTEGEDQYQYLKVYIPIH